MDLKQQELDNAFLDGATAADEVRRALRKSSATVKRRETHWIAPEAKPQSTLASRQGA